MGSEGHARVELDAEGRITSVSAGAEHLYGLSQAAVLGRPLEEVLPGPDGPLPWAARRADPPWSGLECHRPTGVQVWVEARLDAAADGFVYEANRAAGLAVLQRDPVALRRTIAEALDVGSIGLWLDDGVNQEMTWSASCKTHHGIAGEPTHEKLFAATHPDDRAKLAEAIQRAIAEQQPFKTRCRVVTDEGLRHLDMFGRVLVDDDGKMLIGVGGTRDCSLEVEQATRIALLEEQLRQAQKLDVVGRLAGGIAHDFNNLLTAIMGGTELLLLRGQLSETLQREANGVLAAAERAGELTQQLLAFSRRQGLKRESIRVSALLDESSRLLKRIIPATARLRSDDQTADARIVGDPTQLQQVLTNLVVNAAHALPDGGEIALRATATDELVVLEVIDRGVGIPDDVLPHIFEPFFTTRDVGEGTGLGLSVVEGIVHQHGGTIGITSAVGEGTTVRLSFPRDERPVDETVEPGRRDVALSEVAAHVLVVEDERMVREVTRRILEDAGLRVTVAEDGDAALAADAADIDFVVTDVIMPNRTGPELVAELRRTRPDLRVLYVSGYPKQLVDDRFSLGPGDELLAKPFTRAALLQAVETLLHSR